MKKNAWVLIFSFLFVRACLAAPSADEIARKASHAAYYQGLDGRAKVRMVITDSQGRTRERGLTILRFNVTPDAAQKYYVYFHKPNDVRGMSYLVWKYIDKDDDRWLYLPALDLVRRIASSDKRASFAGTNFLYEDISGRNPDLDDHELVSGEGKFYQLKNTPKDSGVVEFSYYTASIDMETFLPMKAEYYDRKGKLYRVIEALEVKDISGYPTIVKMKASDLNSNSGTVSEFSQVEYDLGLTDDIFTERYLRRPPMRQIGE